MECRVSVRECYGGEGREREGSVRFISDLKSGHPSIGYKHLCLSTHSLLTLTKYENLQMSLYTEMQ